MFLSSYRKNKKKKKSLLRIHSSLSCTWSVLLHVLLAVNTRERAEVVAHRWREPISFQESARSRGHVADAVPVLAEPTFVGKPKNVRPIEKPKYPDDSFAGSPRFFSLRYALSAKQQYSQLYTIYGLAMGRRGFFSPILSDRYVHFWQLLSTHYPVLYDNLTSLIVSLVFVFFLYLRFHQNYRWIVIFNT